MGEAKLHCTKECARRRMIVILSPAKTLDLEPIEGIASSTPVGVDDAAYLVGEIQKLTFAKLKALLGTSDGLTSLNHERFKAWHTQAEKQCALSYDGPAYKSLQTHDLTTEDLEFAQSHVRILSALYGVLKPLDMIKPYRLEMGSKLANNEGKDLYMYWRDKVCSWLASDLTSAAEEEQFLVNCASQEYAKVVDTKALGMPVLQITFPGPALHAKAARGAMVRFIILNRVRQAESLKAFTGKSGEWSYNAARSSDSEFVFERDMRKCVRQGSEKPTAKRQKKG